MKPSDYQTQLRKALRWRGASALQHSSIVLGVFRRSYLGQGTRPGDSKCRVHSWCPRRWWPPCAFPEKMWPCQLCRSNRGWASESAPTSRDLHPTLGAHPLSWRTLDLLHLVWRELTSRAAFWKWIRLPHWGLQVSAGPEGDHSSVRINNFILRSI